MFHKILIANRGEIACRIARTCRELGIRSVAVYSDADANAAHVAACDEAYRLGPAPAAESYLSIPRIIDAARRAGADAIHPGYGFLSEKPELAEACFEADIIFIGPPVPAIQAMGSKSAAKAIMGDAGVPLVPGYHGDDQDPRHLAAEARRIGFPVLIKASAGGGGKGMRRVDNPEDFDAALAGARREALNAFGDDRVLIEKYLLRPRHIEIQVFADNHGQVVHLFERDCSIQRRHQKIIEEAPAPEMTPARRQAMGEAAVAAARAIGYRGAGTVEFIMDQDGAFYFMEMNTRLQVEHPVTEYITGQDLVAWQIHVAAGEALPLNQAALHIHGHALEVRLYAEDPTREFLPASGTIQYLHFPESSPHVRIDSGVRQGDTVSVHYDPMIAKLIVWDMDRASALRRLQQALNRTQVVGVTTNVGFLGMLARHPSFVKGGVDTDFISRHGLGLLDDENPASTRMLAMAAIAELLRVDQEATTRAAHSLDAHSPWHATDGWRLNGENNHILHFRHTGEEHKVIAHYRPGGFLLELTDGSQLAAQGEALDEHHLRVTLDGVQQRIAAVRVGQQLSIMDGEQRCTLEVHDPLTAGMDDEVVDGSLSAPMPGAVVAVLVQEGERVSEGQPLMVLEAMKMEHTIRANGPGVVGEIHYQPGDQVQEGIELLVINADSSADS